MGWLRAVRDVRDGRAALDPAEATYMQLMDLRYAYRALEHVRDDLKKENLELRAYVATLEPAYDMAYEAAMARNDELVHMHDALKLARAERDLLYQGAEMVARVHGLEYHDDRRGAAWCSCPVSRM